MSLFLNLVALTLVIAWVVSYLVLDIGAIAHMILLMALFVALANLIIARFSAK
jgi:hypothetical protein